MEEIDLTKYKESPKTQFFVSEFERLEKQKKDLDEISDDEVMRELAEDERVQIEDQQKGILAQMDEILKEEALEEEFPNEIILEVRAGAGGDEASIFAHNLAEMYQRYADKRGWGVKKIHESQSSVGGYKEAVF